MSLTSDDVITHPSAIITYRFALIGSLFPRLSDAKNLRVVVDVILMGDEYTGELVVGVEPSRV